jgi:transposase
VKSPLRTARGLLSTVIGYRGQPGLGVVDKTTNERETARHRLPWILDTKTFVSTSRSIFMGKSRRKEIKHHISETKLDELLREAEDEHRLRRLGFLKNLYRGDSIPEAAVREGRSVATGDRWAEAWNEGGVEALMPSFGGGRPPKLDADEREELFDILRRGQPWTSREIGSLLDDEFGVEYSPSYLSRFLRDLGLSYERSRSERPSQPSVSEADGDRPVGDTLDGADGDEPHNEPETDGRGGWVVEDDRCPDDV